MMLVQSQLCRSLYCVTFGKGVTSLEGPRFPFLQNEMTIALTSRT